MWFTRKTFYLIIRETFLFECRGLLFSFFFSDQSISFSICLTSQCCFSFSCFLVGIHTSVSFTAVVQQHQTYLDQWRKWLMLYELLSSSCAFEYCTIQSFSPKNFEYFEPIRSVETAEDERRKGYQIFLLCRTRPTVCTSTCIVHPLCWHHPVREARRMETPTQRRARWG